MRTKTILSLAAIVVPALFIIGACAAPSSGHGGRAIGGPATEASMHAQRVMTSEYCGKCHPAAYAEHEQNAHGRAFTDAEVRLATGRFSQGDCIRCHTPRPIFETGNGMNPIRRWHGLGEGITCMSCHWKEGVDYGSFQGGADCGAAFDERVAEVEACAACHRNHGTPYQWEKAPKGKAAGNTCVTCHMPTVRRPIAIGGPVRRVHRHTYPGARSESQVREAYDYKATVEGNEVVVRITNSGAGHHFPTELKQRSAESLIVVRDETGAEVSRSRMVFRDPYKRPYGLHLPINTQIGPGETREHRVPLKVASGTVDTEFHFKHYFPIEDHHPDLARMLESERLVFAGVTPSEKEVETAPVVAVVVPEGIAAEAASPANLVDFAHPSIGKVAVDIPDGDSPEDIATLISLFQFPVPEAGRVAIKRLAAMGETALPALVDALGSWDNKTTKRAIKAVMKMGPRAYKRILDGSVSDEFYKRYYCRVILAKMDKGFEVASIDEAPSVAEVELTANLLAGLEMSNALDRRSSAVAIGDLGIRRAVPQLLALLMDSDPDVTVAAAVALSKVRVSRVNFADQAIPAIMMAIDRSYYTETRRDLAFALACLGSAKGVQILIDGLSEDDDLVRESFFAKFFAVTQVHFGYDTFAPRPVRLAAIARIQAWWTKSGGDEALMLVSVPHARAHDEALALVAKLGAGERPASALTDEELMQELSGMGSDAIPALIEGLKYPPGFWLKRWHICQVLGESQDTYAAPFLAATLRDPVIVVAARACMSLELVNDPETLGAVQRYQDRLFSLHAAGTLPPSAGHPDLLLTQAAKTRLKLDDESARGFLVRMLLSDELSARQTAIAALKDHYLELRGYDASASVEERRVAAARWAKK